MTAEATLTADPATTIIPTGTEAQVPNKTESAETIQTTETVKIIHALEGYIKSVDTIIGDAFSPYKTDTVDNNNTDPFTEILKEISESKILNPDVISRLEDLSRTQSYDQKGNGRAEDVMIILRQLSSALRDMQESLDSMKNTISLSTAAKVLLTEIIDSDYNEIDLEKVKQLLEMLKNSN